MESGEAEQAHGGERLMARGLDDAGDQVVAADRMGDAVPADQPRRLGTVEAVHAHDMRAPGERGHRRGIAEGSAQRDAGEQRTVRPIRLERPHHRRRMAGNRALGMEHQLRAAGGAGGGKGQAGRVRGGRVGAVVQSTSVGIERPHGQARDLGSRRRQMAADHQAQRLPVRLWDGRQDRGEVDRAEVPLGDQHAGPGSAEQAADLRGAEPCIHMDRHGADPGTGEDQRQIIGAVRQP
jgi:hypothetical protein